MKNILVIGEICKDIFIYGSVDRISPEAPVPVLNCKERKCSDGMAANVVGNIETLAPDFNVFAYHNNKPIIKERFVDTKSNYVLLRSDSNDEVEEEASFFRLKSLLKGVEVDGIIFSDYNKGFLSTSFIREVSKEYSCPKFLDTKKKIGSWARGIDFVKINRAEFDYNIESGADFSYIKNLIVTTSEKGAFHYEPDKPRRYYDVPSIDSPDVSGAGDTFLAGLSVHYLNTGDIHSSIIFANRCANEAVSRKGVVRVKKEWIA